MGIMALKRTIYIANDSLFWVNARKTRKLCKRMKSSHINNTELEWKTSMLESVHYFTKWKQTFFSEFSEILRTRFCDTSLKWEEILFLTRKQLHITNRRFKAVCLSEIVLKAVLVLIRDSSLILVGFLKVCFVRFRGPLPP